MITLDANQLILLLYFFFIGFFCSLIAKRCIKLDEILFKKIVKPQFLNVDFIFAGNPETKNSDIYLKKMCVCDLVYFKVWLAVSLSGSALDCLSCTHPGHKMIYIGSFSPQPQ